MDLGRESDYTVCTFIDSAGQIIDIYREKGKDWEEMTNAVLTRVKKWNASLLVETNSMGTVIYENLKKQWADTHPFNTSNSSKKDIVETLILAFAEASIKIPSIKLEPVLHHELEVFEMSYNPKTRNVRYAARASFHDDMVLSLCIGWWHKTQNASYGTYAYMGKR